jgi:ribosomal protein S18 acetylase RimI-like enzyme
MNGMLVRRMTAQDWEKSLELRLRALADAPDSFRQTLEEERLRTEEWAEMARRTAEHPDMQSWLAEVDGAEVGITFSRVREDGRTLGISAMWVAPEARGLGVGRALLDASEDWGRQRGLTAVSLSVAEGNWAAEELYRSSGYEPTGASEPLRDGSSLECVQLAKEL